MFSFLLDSVLSLAKLYEDPPTLQLSTPLPLWFFEHFSYLYTCTRGIIIIVQSDHKIIRARACENHVYSMQGGTRELRLHSTIVQLRVQVVSSISMHALCMGAGYKFPFRRHRNGFAFLSWPDAAVSTEQWL